LRVTIEVKFISIVPRLPVDQHAVSHQVDDPYLGDSGAGIERQLGAAIVAQRRVGNLDHQQHIFRTRHGRQIVYAQPKEYEIGLGH